MLEIKDHLHLDPVGRDLMGVMEECHALVQEGKRIRRFITEGLSVLPRLHTVAMGGIGETLFNDVGGFQVEEMYSCRFEDNAKILPHALINLPTIRNYCQTVFYGLLALPNKIIKVKSALQTFTTHFRGSQTFSNCLTVQELRSPPIILGAINRYYCEMANHALYPFDGDAVGEFTTLLAPILAMLDRSVYVADPVTGESTECNSDVDAFEGTKVEIYDYIRTIDRSKVDSTSHVCIDPDEILQALPPLSSSFLQNLVDQAVPQQWKGKVVLKNREEAPPCSACGLDLQEEFVDVLEHFKSYKASIGMGHAH
jgi:hypothetical protein